ncbi:MAG: dihydropteroate synthase [Flavobacteriales bacterium]|nr:dihydropteroate synthase [Flavobacteriales bacterium]
MSIPKTMGIINATPDSFYDGGKNNSVKNATELAEKHMRDGATFLDIGGFSSRPGGENIDSKIEIERIIPIIKSINKRIPEAIISVDTFRHEVAREALNEGASLINDISAWELDNNLFNLIKEFKVPYILMHMKGKPSNMQKNPQYKNIIEELILYFSLKIQQLNLNGIKDVIIDPGFGFGKNINHNFTILNDLNELSILDKPILVGLSRKSMIYKPLKTNSLNSLNGTTALNMLALENGAKILRVHDIKEAQDCIELNNILPFE